MTIGRATTTKDREFPFTGVADAVCSAGGDTDRVTCSHLELLLTEPHHPAAGSDVVQLLAFVVAVQMSGRAYWQYGLGQALVLTGMQQGMH